MRLPKEIESESDHEAIVIHAQSWATEVCHRVRYVEQLVVQERCIEKALSDISNTLLSQHELKWFLKVISRSIASECRALTETDKDSRALPKLISYVWHHIESFTYDRLGQVTSGATDEFAKSWMQHAAVLTMQPDDFDKTIVQDFVDSNIAHVLDYPNKIAKGQVVVPMAGNFHQVADSIIQSASTLWKLFTGDNWERAKPPVSLDRSKLNNDQQVDR